MNPTPIDGAGVRLRPFRADDTDAVVEACSDPLTQQFLPTLPAPYTRADAEHWIGAAAPALFQAGGAAYAIADPATDALLGSVGLDRLVAERQQAEIGYWVAPWARGRGVARAATTALTTWAFGHGFARLELLTDWTNAASQRVALAAGYRREGVRRGAGNTRAGGRDDLLVFARLADDPPGPVCRLLPDLPGGELSDGVVTLRPLGPADETFLNRLHTLPDVVATSVPPVAPPPDEIRLRCARTAARWLAGERADLVILDAASDAPTGEIQLTYKEPEAGQAMVGYSMVPEWRGRGYPTRAAQLLALWAFAETGIARLVAGTLPDNVRSQRVLEKAGFRREGYQRSRIPGQGGRVDDVLFALVAQDVLGVRGPAG